MIYRTHATVYTAGGGYLMPIILDDVVCLGSENDLFACSHTPVYFSNCGHDEDIGVTCGMVFCETLIFLSIIIF